MAALSSLIETCNDRYAHDCKDGVTVTRWRRPWIRVPRLNNVALCGFCGKKIWQQRISTKKCCPCSVNIAYHSKTTSFGGNAYLTMTRWKEQCARPSDSNQKNFTPQVSRDLWNGETSVQICLEITLKNKCCLYVIIHICLFSITVCNLFIDYFSYIPSSRNTTKFIVLCCTYCTTQNNKFCCVSTASYIFCIWKTLVQDRRRWKKFVEKVKIMHKEL